MHVFDTPLGVRSSTIIYYNYYPFKNTGSKIVVLLLFSCIVILPLGFDGSPKLNFEFL